MHLLFHSLMPTFQKHKNEEVILGWKCRAQNPLYKSKQTKGVSVFLRYKLRESNNSYKICKDMSVLFLLFLVLFKYSCLHFYPTTTPALPITASHSRTYPLGLCPCVPYTCSLMALPLLSLSPLLSGHCQFVLYFNVSGYILLTCLLIRFHL